MATCGEVVVSILNNEGDGSLGSLEGILEYLNNLLDGGRLLHHLQRAEIQTQVTAAQQFDNHQHLHLCEVFLGRVAQFSDPVVL